MMLTQANKTELNGKIIYWEEVSSAYWLTVGWRSNVIARTKTPTLFFYKYLRHNDGEGNRLKADD